MQYFDWSQQPVKSLQGKPDCIVAFGILSSIEEREGGGNEVRIREIYRGQGIIEVKRVQIRKGKERREERREGTVNRMVKIRQDYRVSRNREQLEEEEGRRGEGGDG